TATPTHDISPLSLHDALPIFHFLRQIVALLAQVRGSLGRQGRPGGRLHRRPRRAVSQGRREEPAGVLCQPRHEPTGGEGLLIERSEEHTSELQSLTNLVCRLL